MIESPAGAGQPVEAVLASRVQMAVKQSAQIQSSAKSFAAAAGSGFHIEPQAAATLINACRDALNNLNNLLSDLENVRQAPQLGTTPGAKVVAPFTQNAATDPRGIMPAITNLKQTLQDMIHAYQKASTNYAETEALVQQAMKQQQGTLS